MRRLLIPVGRRTQGASVSRGPLGDSCKPGLFEVAAAACGTARRCRGGQAKGFGRAADRADFIGRIVIVDDDLLQRTDERFLQILGTNRLLGNRSEEHTSELQSLMRISYAVFCLKKKTKNN